ncbi:TonB-dependent receptor [Pelomonas sp. KK5]|uniref:TonB-dependent receptor n=1 Tax=Pelomonas sp. KK5 TaxID=1855730 RepID=UPI001E3D2FDC|nr:TonB-dependent receptor [Pelomonas sp. KK5]
MHPKRTPIAVAGLVLMASLQAQAQEGPALETVVVTGIRAATEKALTMKREASANVDVITAVDVGKMPDKNLADSLQRVVGVAVRTDYDEAEKVSMRGTNPDMSLILFNGHTVSGGDWYLADQSSSSRSTSLSLMPSSVLNAATVYKTSQANIADGGLAGTINVTTRKPLDEKQKFGGLISVGGVYADLPGKSSPQVNGSFNWKNEASNFGVIGQLFAEKRYVRRDSVSRAGYGSNSGWDVIDINVMKGITDASLAGTGLKAADLQGVRLPGSMATEFVEGVRDRKGGMLALQARPTDKLDLGLTGFYSRMNSNNYGRASYSDIQSMLRGLSGVQGDTTTKTSVNGQQVFASIRNPVIVNETTIYGQPLKVLKSAQIMYADGTPAQLVGENEGFYRSGAGASSGFLDFDFKYQLREDLKVKGLLSTTKGVGHTDADRGYGYARYGQGVSYTLNGLQEAPDFQYYGTGANVPVRNADGSGYQLVAANGANSHHTVDSEKSLALDFEYTQDSGIFSTLEFGGRTANHDRQYRRTIKAVHTAALPAFDPNLAVGYPGDFGNGLGGGNWENTGFYFPTSVMVDYFNNRNKDTTAAWERFVSSEIDVRERQTALYAMQNLEGNKWSGNIGFRLVRTTVDALIPTPIPSGICARTEPGKPAVPCAAFPDAITDAGNATAYYDGTVFNPVGQTWYKKPSHKNFDNILPSLNLRWELTKDLIGRLGLSETLGRQNYNVYGTGFSSQTCGTQGCTVNGPNPNLKPMTARNFDLSLAWFYDRRAMVSASLFDSLIDGYAKTGAVKQDATVDLFDTATNTMRTYMIQSTSQQKARIRGVELAWEQPVGAGFGVTTNASYAETHVEDGRPMVGASKIAGNFGVYFENDIFSTRLVWNYRGAYVSSSTAPSPTANSQGLSTINGVLMPTAPTIAAPVTNVALTINYNITPELQLSFSGTNLTNPTRAQYRYSEAEQQKLDVSGRQYYLEARYKF